jgi:multicomponent K+:H+ antiporter subunit A
MLPPDLILLAVVLLPFAGSLAPLLVDRPGRSRTPTAWAAASFAIGSLALLGLLAPRVFAGEVIEASWAWLPRFGVNVTFRLDGYAWMFACLVFGIGLLILLYARYYLSQRDAAGRFFAMLMLFMGSMAGVVTSGNLILLGIFWELTSLSSFLLIGFWFHLPAARHGARMALTVTGAGGLALLGGLIMLGIMAGSFEMTEVFAAREQILADPLYVPMLLLVLVGAFTKSAQFPFHFWLPHAMTAPTPVSAYLHSATMVKAGVFLLGRFYYVLAGTPEWMLIVGGVGLITLLLGAYAALFEHDLKGLLAYSTISHLGLITLLFGFGTQVAAIAAVFHIINHATFKASLFMAAGIIDHETGTRDMRILNGLAKYMPWTAALAIVASAAMAGVPLLNGFLSKEMFFAESLLIEGPQAWQWVVPVLATLAAVFSVAYSVRFIHQVFFSGDGTGMPKTPHEPPRFMRVPVEVLVVLCVAVGVAPYVFVRPTLDVASRGVLGLAELPYYSLSIWHGFNLPLLMSAIALAGGVGLYAWRQYLYSAHDRFIPAFTAEQVYSAKVDLLSRFSGWLTRTVENGSLQRYLAFMVIAALVAGAAPALRHDWTTGPVTLLPIDAASAIAFVVLVVAAIATAVLHRRRMTALITISAVGLLVALTFVRFSAPDLALTQLLVEVVTILLVLLALNVLPKQSPVDSSVVRRGRDIALAALAGAGTAALTWAILTRPGDSISAFFLAESYRSGGGTNVVNVILVDFRGFDTMGEIAVLGIAALGVVVMLAGLRVTDPLRSAKLAADRYPVILTMIARPLLPLALLMSIYLMLRGHNLPGGGFIGGLMAAIALIIQYLASGRTWTNARLHADFQTAVGIGILIAVLSGVGAWLFGYPFLTSAFTYVTLPVVGRFELATAMIFDIGVFITVVASVMLILARLGGIGGELAPDDAFPKETSPWKP